MEKEKTPASESRQCPVARIPWLPFKKSAVKPEDNKFFQVMMTKGEEGSRRLDFYRILTKTFPFYLPKRYHSMDCLALHENSPNGEYWANATHFLFCFQVFGYSFHKALSEESKSENPDFDKFRSMFDHEFYSTLQKEDVEECKSAAEFLLEPWILVQLPFQPLLFHQWSVALLAEAVKLYTELQELCYIPRSLHAPVNKLFKMCNLLYQSAFKFFEHLSTYIYKGEESLSTTVSSDFFKNLPEVMPVIEFVLSDERKNIIKALTKITFETTTYDYSGQRECVVRCRDGEFHCYSSHFWMQKSLVHCISSEEFLLPWNEKHYENDDFKAPEISASEIEELKILIEEKFITSGLIKGASKEFIFDLIHGRTLDKLMLLYRMHKATLEKTDESAGIQERDCGVIYNLICLYAKPLMTFLLAVVRIELIHKSAHKCRHVSLNTAHLEGPKMTVRSISDKIDRARKADKKWTVQNIFKNLRATCFSSSRDRYPNFNQGPEKIAAHFQERMRNLVFKMLERQYLTRRKGVRVVYPECQFIQNLLPCFIASFLDMYKDPSVPQDKKKECLKFVDNLVESYETQEFYQEVGTELKQPFTFCAQSLDIILLKLSQIKINLQNIWAGSKLFEMLDLLTCNDKAAEEFLAPWIFQQFMLFSRINSCLKVIKQDQSDIVCNLMLLVNLFKNYDSLMNDDSQTQIALPFDQQPLDEYQDFGLTVYYFFRFLNRDKFRQKMSSSQGPGFPLDDIDSAMWALFSGDMWTVKQKVSSMAHKSGQDDQTLASLELAKSNVFYEEALKTGLTEDGKVKMSQPGEITFFPVKHCRWCGLLEAETFRKCPVCVDNPDFPDVNYFCSAKCETESLDKQHTEEHATFLVIRCGIH